MTKKDYELIADCISSTKGFFAGGVTDFASHLINALSKQLEIDNPNFDREKFTDACQIK